MNNQLAQNMVSPIITEPPTLTLQEQFATVNILKMLWAFRFLVPFALLVLFIFRKKISKRTKVVFIILLVVSFAASFYLEYLLFGYVNVSRFFVKYSY